MLSVKSFLKLYCLPHVKKGVDMGHWHIDRERTRLITLHHEFSREGVLLSANCLLARTAELVPHKPALMLPSRELITYDELARTARLMSRYLMQYNIKPGDRIAMLVENSSFFYSVYYGIWQTGATVVPLSTFLHEAEVQGIVAEAQLRLVIVSQECAPKLTHGSLACPLITEQQLMQAVVESGESDFVIQPLAPHEPAVILYTSGTTGRPKGVMLSSHGIMTNLLQGMSRFNFVEDERVLCPLPLFHSFTQNTCVWGAIAAGITVIILPKIMKGALINSISLKPTIILGIPNFFGLLCRISSLSLSSTRYCVSGGDALPDAIRRIFALRFGKKICNGYGLTESGPVIAVDLDDSISPVNTVGKPMIGIICDIRDHDQGIGTLWIRGDNVMLGYYQAPEATEKIMHNGWLNTGDLARFTDEGKLVICGREKDLIVHKGLKIYPQEVENTLMNAPQVLLAAVVGITDAEGAYPVAVVQPFEGKQVDIHELIDYCKQRLAAYKVPRAIVVVKSMPLTATGKINKKELLSTVTLSEKSSHAVKDEGRME
jgi:long-chain acyl-CoA synthetase